MKLAWSNQLSIGTVVCLYHVAWYVFTDSKWPRENGHIHFIALHETCSSDFVILLQCDILAQQGAHTIGKKWSL